MPFLDLWLYVALTMFALLSVYWAIGDVFELRTTTSQALRLVDAQAAGEDPVLEITQNDYRELRFHHYQGSSTPVGSTTTS